MWGRLIHAYLTHLAMERFRNIDLLAMDMEPKLNLLTGQNAQGKTSILEGIYLASTGRILRASRDSVVIQHKADQARVLADAEPGGTRIQVTLTAGRRKQIQVNGITLTRASDVLGKLPSVCFSAADLALVDGEPSDRRAFADEELSQLYPAYFRHFAAYKRALEQRNALLKLAQVGPVNDDEFLIWEERLQDAGEAMMAYRHAWLAETERYAREFQSVLGMGEILSLGWVIKDEGPLDSLLHAARRHDIARGATSIGPHRDDIEIKINGHEAKAHASQGQKRSIVIALKAAVLETARSVLGFSPVLLLDDVFSDLDERRRSTLIELALNQGGQTFITCTEPEQAGGNLLSMARVFRVQCGAVTVL